jgi:hypothetical protein
MLALRTVAGCAAALLAASGAFAAEDRVCSVGRFEGAASPAGAEVTMRVVNVGRPCAIVNHGIPSERTHPADRGRITQPPAHGSAQFAPPEARYTPAPGFAGRDDFAYEAFARGRSDQRVHLRVRVRVEVVAP